MVLNDPTATINALLCAGVVITLMFYRRGDSRHRPWISRLAWLITVTYSAVPLAYLCGIYAVENLVPTFGSHRITQQQSAALGRTATQPANQKAIANLVYGGEWGKEHLGNQVAGDGWKYRGRGLKQITGLSNYRSCGQALKLDLVTHPELLEKDEYAARSAAWFYASRGCLLHSGDIERVTLLINGGRNGLDKRRALFNLAKSVLV